MVHVPVMVTEVVKLLLTQRCNTVFDGTVGGGGHTEALLRASDSVRVIGVDRDKSAVAAARRRLERFGDRVALAEASYTDIGTVLDGSGTATRVDGVLLDLGLSTLQLDDPERGFSYQNDGPLDMRMGDSGRTARDVIAQSSAQELADAIKASGERRGARKIARAIKRAEEVGAMKTTRDLKRSVEEALGRPVSPSRLSRVFQAIRIVVNGEIENLRLFLDTVFDHVNNGARLVFISYHSLEDREIKQFFNHESSECVCPSGTPICVCDHTPRIEKVTRRALRPSKDEIADNPRARSAHLRAAQVL